MDSTTPSSVHNTIPQLNAARGLALKDAAYYPEIVQGVLPIVGANAAIELRRWGADFFAETFASPKLLAPEKERLSLLVLQTLKDYLDIPVEDAAVVKNAVQAAASIYPLVFKHIITNPQDASIWQIMAAIKSNILRRMDTASPGVRICCIKFVQQIVQTQTPGQAADPRRTEHNDISLSLVPRDHPIIPPSNLEAEASGLLDRLLSILQENNSDALLVTATLNSLGSLVRNRTSIANKIISTVLNFNPLKLANSPMTPKSKVMMKSMERTTRAWLINVNKRNPNNPLAPRIQQYLERLQHTRTEVLDEANRKRPPPAEPTDGLDAAKRQRLSAEVQNDLTGQLQNAPPLPSGAVSFAQLFTLTDDEGLKSFDVQAISADLALRITISMLISIDKIQLDKAINAVRARYLNLSKTQPAQPPPPPPAPPAVDATPIPAPPTEAPVEDEEEEDYEPDFPTEDAEQILNALDPEPEENTIAISRPPEVALGTFTMPQPPPLAPEETEEYGRITVNRVFAIISSFEEYAVSKASRAGFNRFAGSSYDRDAWVTMIARLATRGSAGLNEDDEDHDIKMEDEPRRDLALRNGTGRGAWYNVADTVRDSLYIYVVEDFRRRIEVAIAWLNEKWYSDRLQTQHARRTGQEKDPVLNYDKWVLKFLDGIIPYLDAKDKVLIRLLSEIPAIGLEVLERVKKIARDPERVSLATSALHYLILLRPPVRDICIDALEDLWRNYDDARAPASKLLTKWRPHVLQEEANGVFGDVKAG